MLRSEAIDFLKSEGWDDIGAKEIVDTYIEHYQTLSPQDAAFGRGRNSVIEEIRNAPSIWTPCKERQPSQTGNYLVTAYDDRTGYFVLELSYTPTTDGGWYDEDEATGLVDWNDLAIAWMHLPSPYVPEKEKK